ncbi:type II toxin-antitoxin system VapC family toxin [soil metagenome]
MIFADSNIWLILAIPQHEFHAVVEDWVSQQSDTFEFCRSTQQSYLRHLTNQSTFKRYGIPAFSNNDAWAFFNQIIQATNVVFMDEPQGLSPIWERFSQHKQPSPKLWMDAYLAAFAVAADIKFVTTDSGFRQYPDLKLTLLPEVPSDALPS